MEQRNLGSTGLQVSVLGYGSGAGGGLMTRGDVADQKRAVKRAIDAGITYFDTAPGYGSGSSEENLGRVLGELGVWGDVVVGTKVRPVPGVADQVAAVRRSVEQSLHRLNHDSVDLLQLHNPVSMVDQGSSPTGDDLLLDEVLGGVAEGMLEVQRAGLVAHLGFTGLGETVALHALARDGRFRTVQGYFNALNPSAGYPGAKGGGQDFDGLIDVASASGVGTIAFRVLAAGALLGQPEHHPLAGTPDAPLDAGPTWEGNMERARALHPILADLGLESLIELALRFAQSKPGVCTALVGFSDMDQLDDALRWTERGPLPADSVERIVDLARGRVE